MYKVVTISRQQELSSEICRRVVWYKFAEVSQESTTSISKVKEQDEKVKNKRQALCLLLPGISLLLCQQCFLQTWTSYEENRITINFLFLYL
jgi:hypothetical protein